MGHLTVFYLNLTLTKAVPYGWDVYFCIPNSIGSILKHTRVRQVSDSQIGHPQLSMG